MKKVLIVENSPTIISVADSLLRQRGYDVTCLSDGKKAVKFAQNEKPDLILTAVGLSGMDGLELCKQISSNSITGGIPIILLISDKDSVYQDKFDTCGARGRMKKPFSPKDLVATVDKFTGNLKQKSPRVVNQNSEDGPRLEPKVAPNEIGTATNNLLTSKGGERDGKHETVFNLDWNDLKDDPDFQPERQDTAVTDDTGLILEDDQYGLTKLPEEVEPPAKADQDEDYDWFIGEMKKEIEGDGNAGDAQAANKQTQQAKSDISYDNIGGKPTSKDDAKYRQFLEQFKKDASVMTEEKPSPGSDVDVNWLVDRVADKLAQKIVEKLDKSELKKIIGSMLGNMK